MVPDPTRLKTLAQVAEDTRLNLARGILSYIKHELSQPLGAILLTTEACAMGIRAGRMDPGQVAADLAEINRLAEEANSLLVHVRDLAGPVTAERISANANEPLAQLLAAMATDLDSAGIETQLDLAKDLPAFALDPRLLTLAILELLRNARDALPSGGKVHVRSAVQDTNTLTIAISDSGPGVGELTIDKLTTPFFTTRQGHLGMGLTLCRTFVEAQGGKLALNPGADGRGACFVIQLPAN